MFLFDLENILLKSWLSMLKKFRTVTASPVSIQSTPGTIRLIQPIQLVSSPRPAAHTGGSSARPAALSTAGPPRSQELRLSPTSPRPTKSPRPTSSSRPFFDSSSVDFLSSSPVPKPLPSSSRLTQQQQKPALKFVDNGLVAVLGRQVKGGKGKPVDGFPNGLPDLTPLGVRITLENMLGKFR